MRRFARGLAALALLGLTAMAPQLPDPIEEALEMKSRTAGAEFLEAEAKGADEQQAPWYLLYAAELRRLSGQAEEARALFQEVTEQYPASRAKDPAVLGLTVVDAGEAASGNTLATLALIADKNVPDTLNADRYLLLARAKAAEGAAESSIRALSDKAVKYAAGTGDVSKRVKDAVVALDTVSADLAEEPAGPRDLAAIERIRDLVVEGELVEAGERARRFVESFADSPFLREAEYVIRRAETGVRPDPGLVAVLLPSTGSYAIPAESIKAAVELGNQHAGGALRLAFYDTGGTPEQCVKALEKATLEQGASLVIGPLLKEEALVCAPAAQAIRVPMITLTSSEEVLAAGDQVFRAMPSTEQQVEALLRETYDTRAMKRYAVLHPTTPYGENAARIFVDAVAARGGQVTARASYDPAASDFREPARILGKKDYKARASEFYRLKKDAEKNKQDPDKVMLPPLVDYEAIFIPDGYQRVALIASALAFEEFPVGRFKARREDTPVPLLGLSAWNNDELARRGGVYVQDAIFVDAFDPRVDGAATDAFLDAWKDLDKGDPTVVEAVVYDATRLVAEAVAADGDHDEALATVRLENPVAGTLGFGEDRQLARSWRLLTVTKEGVRPLQPPEPPPDENDAGQ